MMKRRKFMSLALGMLAFSVSGVSLVRNRLIVRKGWLLKKEDI